MKLDLYKRFLRGNKDRVSVYGTDTPNKGFELSKNKIKKVCGYVALAALIVTSSIKVSEFSSHFHRINGSPFSKEKVVQLSHDKEIQELDIQGGTQTNSTVENSSLQRDLNDKKEFVISAEYDSIYNDVVQKYKLYELQEQEFLPKEMVDSIFHGKETLPLYDENYNHLPENNDNFWEIVSNGVHLCRQSLDNSDLSYNQQRKYLITTYKMLSKISRIKGTYNDIDLSQHNNLQAFNYFEKIVNYKGDYDKIFKEEQGVIPGYNDVYGRYYKDAEKLEEVANANPWFRTLVEELYASDMQFIISREDSVRANQLAAEFYDNWLDRQNIDKAEAEKMVQYSQDYDSNIIVVHNSRTSDLYAYVEVNQDGELSNGKFLPPPLSAVCELIHLMQAKSASNERVEDNVIKEDLDSLSYLPSKDSGSLMPEAGHMFLMLGVQDKDIKNIHEMDIDSVANYGIWKRSDGHKVHMGKLANLCRKFLLVDKCDEPSIDKAITDPEFLNELCKLCCKEYNNPEMVPYIQSKINER